MQQLVRKEYDVKSKIFWNKGALYRHFAYFSLTFASFVLKAR